MTIASSPCFWDNIVSDIHKNNVYILVDLKYIKDTKFDKNHDQKNEVPENESQEWPQM